jgi:hypothetical protein
MISTEQIKQTIADCKKAGHTVSVRDISYVILATHFEDGLVAYKSIFGNDYDYNQEYWNTYDQTASIEYLHSYVEMTLLSEKKAKKQSEDISFEENKAYMLKLKKDTEDAMANNELEKKDGLKILADLSVKLNDKFKVASDETQQQIYVSCKYNAICECGKEIYIPTKEVLMEKYGLVEKD